MDRKNNYLYLIDKAQAGDTDSMNQLLNCIQNPLYFYIYRTTQSYDVTWDLLQETLLTILKSINQLKKPENFRAWTHRIAYNKIQDHFRDKKRRRTVEITDFDDNQRIKETQKNNSVLKLLSKREEMENLHCAIEQLDNKHRNIVELRVLGSISYQKIAALTDSTCEQVRSKFYRAKWLLKDKLFSIGMKEVG